MKEIIFRVNQFTVLELFENRYGFPNRKAFLRFVNSILKSVQPAKAMQRHAPFEYHEDMGKML